MEINKSLKTRGSELADKAWQVKYLSNGIFQNGKDEGLPTFRQKIKLTDNSPLKPTQIEIFQVNVGYMCNQVCKHCHVDAGPDRKEIMTKEIMQEILDVLQKHRFPTLDLTGGAPEMNPNFRWFVQQAAQYVDEIIVRSNLTIITASEQYYDLPEFFKNNKCRVVASLPFYKPEKTDRQRGKRVFEKSIDALQKLNAVGFGKPDSGLIMDLVYNPSGAFLPAEQSQLEADFKKELKTGFDIEFNSLFTITNLPISRFLEYLIKSENYEDYMEMLVDAFNPSALKGVMCRNTISIDWQGNLYDCDFNQMLDLKVGGKAPKHISEFDLDALVEREIVINQHCYGCTAGAGSSCQGALVE